jgi:uncharacterized protein YxjI
MNLYIKQKVFTWRDKFYVYNENGEGIFKVEGELFSWGAKLHLYDAYDRELYFIKQKLMVFLPEYEIYQGENLIARVKKEFSFFKPRLNVTSHRGKYVIQGNFLGMDFQILYNNQLLGAIKKEWFTWGDTYCLYIANNEDAAFFTALVIAIDNCLHNESGSTNH